MSFPPTNKIKQPLEESFGANAKVLETSWSQLDWRKWLKFWAVGLALACITLFCIIFSIKLALFIL